MYTFDLYCTHKLKKNSDTNQIYVCYLYFTVSMNRHLTHIDVAMILLLWIYILPNVIVNGVVIIYFVFVIRLVSVWMIFSFSLFRYFYLSFSPISLTKCDFPFLQFCLLSIVRIFAPHENGIPQCQIGGRFGMREINKMSNEREKRRRRRRI